MQPHVGGDCTSLYYDLAAQVVITNEDTPGRSTWCARNQVTVIQPSIVGSMVKAGEMTAVHKVFGTRRDDLCHSGASNWSNG